MTDPRTIQHAALEAAHALNNGWRPRPDITDDEERRAEDRAHARDDYWEPQADFDDPGPDGHGWAPDPFPGGGLI